MMKIISRCMIFRTKRTQIFLITYLAYAILYATRKPFSVVKTDVQSSLGISTDWLGIIDTSFLAAYAVGQLLIPTLLAHYPSMSAAVILLVLYGGSGISAFIFGLVSSPVAFSFLWIINGVLHAAVFPLLITCLTPWFPSSERGKVMGAWTTSQQTGAIAATGMSAWMAAHLGWRAAFTIPGVITLAFGFFLAWAMDGTLTDGTSTNSHQSPLPATDATIDDERMPNHEGIELTADKLSLEKQHVSSDTPSGAVILDLDARTIKGTPRSNALSMAAAPLVSIGQITDVKGVSCSYFCVKCIRYSLLFWLPYYLATELHYPHEIAGYTSIIFDIGGVAGGICAGQMADRYFSGRRMFVAALACVAGTISLLAFSIFASSGKLMTLSLLGLIGIAIAAADSIIGGSAASDICERAKCSGSMIGAVSGIINGCGSVGAVLQGYLTSRLTQTVGWPAFYFILAMVALAGGSFLVVPSFNELASSRAAAA